MTDSVWAARLLPASWRGIPFFIEHHELRGGRNAVDHEPPDRDSTFAEDIGRKGKKYIVEGHVLGDNYFFIRDGLIKAMEKKGSGILIHPYLGAKELQPEGYTLKETTDEGRIARFSFTFIEAGEPSAPFAILDAVTDFVTSVVVGVAQVQNAFQVAFKVASLPSFAVDSAKAVAKDFTTSIRNGIKNVRLKPEQQAKLTRDLDNYDNNTEALTRNPASNTAEVDNLISSLKDVVEDPPDNFTVDTTLGRDDKLDVFITLLSFTSVNAIIIGDTPTRIQERINANAYIDMIKQLAIIRLSEQAIAKTFESINSAIALRETIGEFVNEQLAKTPSDDVFQALKDMYSKLVSVLPDDNTTLASVKSLSFAYDIPSLVLAYDLYESPDNERDILDRNRVRNPGFIIGDVEVLTSG